jgi:hypothetical protein
LRSMRSGLWSRLRAPPARRGWRGRRGGIIRNQDSERGPAVRPRTLTGLFWAELFKALQFAEVRYPRHDCREIVMAGSRQGSIGCHPNAWAHGMYQRCWALAAPKPRG